MSPDVSAPDRVDGRRARRDRNRNLALDCAIEMFSEESLVPSIEDVAQRSGLSLRSLYRYFEDADALVHAAIERSLASDNPFAHIPAIGEGPLSERIEVFVDVRVRLYLMFEASFRATIHHASRNPPILEALEATRRRLRRQFEAQFAPELGVVRKGTRELLLNAGDALTQFDTIDMLRRFRRLSVAATAETLSFGLTGLFQAAEK